MKNCRLKFNLLLGNSNLLDVPLIIAGNHLDTVSVLENMQITGLCVQFWAVLFLYQTDCEFSYAAKKSVLELKSIFTVLSHCGI